MSGSPVHVADWIAIGAYLLVIVALGAWAARRTTTTEDYFLAGRSLWWPVAGLSLFATNISSSSLVGLAGGAYQMGLAVYNYEWTAILVLLVFVVLFLPVYRRVGITTVPEFLERRFDQRTRRFFSALSAVASILVDMAGTLYAGALVLRVALPAFSLEVCVGFLAGAAGLYAVVGGLRAVVYTDVLQATLLLVGAAFVAVGAYEQAGGWDAVVAATAPEMRRLVLPAGSDVLPWPGLVTGLLLLGIYYWCINQVTVQRTLAARSLRDARWGALLAGAFKLPVLGLIVMPGLLALVIYPGLENPDFVFPRLAFDLLPAGLRGLVLVALLAAVMSSIDSVLNSVATLVTMDFYAPLRPQVSEGHLVVVGRGVAALVLVLGAVIAPQIAHFSSLWIYLQSALAYVTPPIVAVFVGGLFWKRANRQGALATLAGGSLMAVGVLLADPALHFLYVAALLFVASVALMAAVSYATPPPAEHRDALWRREDAAMDPRARWAVALLLGAVGALVGFFW